MLAVLLSVACLHDETVATLRNFDAQRPDRLAPIGTVAARGGGGGGEREGALPILDGPTSRVVLWSSLPRLLSYLNIAHFLNMPQIKDILLFWVLLSRVRVWDFYLHTHTHI